MSAPAVSIIIPTWNQKVPWLTDAICSALSQSVRAEVIVVDDGSDDPVFCLAPVRVIRRDHLGVAAALNAGIKVASTDWICWLSSDDWIEPRKVEVQLGVMREVGAKASCHPYAVMTTEKSLLGYSQLPPMMCDAIMRANELKQPIPKWWQYATIRAQMQDFANNCWVNGSTTMIHRSVFDEVGLFDERLKYGQDWEFWCRVGEKHQWLFVNALLGIRREGGNLTEMLSKTPDQWRIARDEDRQIRERYRP